MLDKANYWLILSTKECCQVIQRESNWVKESQTESDKKVDSLLKFCNTHHVWHTPNNSVRSKNSCVFFGESPRSSLVEHCPMDTLEVQTIAAIHLQLLWTMYASVTDSTADKLARLARLASTKTTKSKRRQTASILLFLSFSLFHRNPANLFKFVPFKCRNWMKRMPSPLKTASNEDSRRLNNSG